LPPQNRCPLSVKNFADAYTLASYPSPSFSLGLGNLANRGRNERTSSSQLNHPNSRAFYQCCST